MGLGKNTGVYQGFRYMIAEKELSVPETAAGETVQSTESEVKAAKILVALDISSDRGNLLRILGISVLIAALWWAAMLLPVHALAKRAIAPTALSIERQKQFVTNAGHELKTPLAIIQANTDALELYTGESKWTRNIRAQTVRLDGLMQNLLTLSRMDENSLQLEKKPFVLDLLVGEVWENFAEPAAGRKLSVQIKNEENRELKVLANRESIAQLLSILFDNAVKYTPRGGRIGIDLMSAADGVHLVQSNTILKEEAEKLRDGNPDRLFDRFYRTDSDRSRKKGGYGIGLSIAESICTQYKGTIRVSWKDGIITFTCVLGV
jgi:signal transduction histidine kinase